MSTQTYTNSVTLSDATEFNRFDTAAYPVLTSVAGTNTITATGPANYSLSSTMPPLVLIPAVTNTSATTLNITPSGGSALTAKNVFSGGAACVGGELVAGVPSLVYYDGTQFNIIGARIYKEGTFTPGVAFGGGVTGITYGTQNGLYTRNGRVINYTLNIVLTNKGSSTGAATITGLPFTSAATYIWTAPIYGDNFQPADTTSLIAQVGANGTTLTIHRYAAGAISNLDDTDFANNTIIRISGHYSV